MRKTTRRKAVHLLMACLMVSTPKMFITGCGNSGSFLGMHDYQRDLLFGFGALAIALLSNRDGGGSGNGDGDPTRPIDGTGLACWDLDEDGVADPEEDINADGNFDALDCRGPAGESGTDGMSCWDVNENGQADPGEDVNDDGFFNAFDCQGTPGLACWDLNGNGIGDPAENVNGDNAVNVLDCRGAQGLQGLTGQVGPAIRVEGSAGVDPAVDLLCSERRRGPRLERGGQPRAIESVEVGSRRHPRNRSIRVARGPVRGLTEFAGSASLTA